MRLPNRYGVIGKMSGKRRRPFIAKKFVRWETDDEKKKVRPVYKVVGYYATKKEALEALAQANLNPESDDSITFDQVYEEWAKKKNSKIADTNMKNYQSAYKYLTPLHDQVFADINTFDIENCITDMNVPRTIRRYCKMLMHQMYHYAIAHDICDKDYSKLADYKIDNSTEIARKVFTADEVKDLFQKADVISDMLLVSLYTGMRPIEVTGLRNDEVDLEHDYLRIRGSKTKNGLLRRCPLHKDILSIIQRNLVKSGKFKARTVFVGDDGKEITYAYYYDKVVRMGHTPHDTRHTFASNAKMCHMDEYARKLIMGHAIPKANVTDSVYTHVSDEWLAEEMKKYHIC